MTDQQREQRNGSNGGPLLHPWAWLAALVLLGAGVGSDALSQRSDRQYVDAHRAWELYGWGTAAAVVAVVLFIAHVVSLDAEVKRRALPHLVPLDLTLLWFGYSYLSRRSSSLVPAAVWEIAVSGIVGLISLAGLGLEVRRLRSASAAVADASPVDEPIES